jgi:hypothetical protein
MECPRFVSTDVNGLWLLAEWHEVSSYMVYPRTFYTDLDVLWLLARFGETGWVEGLTTFSGPQEGRENRAVTGRKFLLFPRRGAHALNFTKSGQEP